MTEALIRAKAKIILSTEGWYVWCPQKARWGQERDVFGVFDAVALKERQVRWIQWTVKEAASSHRKKIADFLHEKNIRPPGLIELWLWDNKKREFKIESISKLDPHLTNKVNRVISKEGT